MKNQIWLILGCDDDSAPFSPRIVTSSTLVLTFENATNVREIFALEEYDYIVAGGHFRHAIRAVIP